MKGNSIETFHIPTLGKFDHTTYIEDVFEFMRSSTELFDSRTKSISYEGEIVSFQPCLHNEDFESIFVNHLM